MNALLNPEDKRYCLFPIKEHDIWKYYKEQESVFWTAQEVDLSQDLHDWKNNLNENERYFIKHVLAFFSQSDGIVNENLALNFLHDVKILEAQFFYGIQFAIENVHNEMYSLLIDTYVDDEKEKKVLFNAIETYPAIKRKAEWAFKYIKEAPFRDRLVAFAIVEGLFFSGAFCSIFWLKNRGLMRGLTLSNEFISRDEFLHANFACHLYRNWVDDKMTKNDLNEMMKHAVEIEKEFILESLPVKLIGMNSDLMGTYIEYVADRLLENLGSEAIYGASNPFPWMTLIAVEGKTNFFESRVSSYAKSRDSITEEDTSTDF